MDEEEVVWRRICIGVWIGRTVEQIREDLEREYGIPFTPEMEALIKYTKRKYDEEGKIKNERLERIDG